jgi:HTH-type transcriptional regulator/antitoxin HigA
MRSIPDYAKKMNNIRSAFIKRRFMESPEYRIIKSREQYKNYCNLLEGLVMTKRKTRAQQDTIELLTLLIEKWDEAHNSFSKADPVELLVN